MPNRYNRFQSLLHWLTALALVFLLITGTFVLEGIPNSDPEKLGKLTIHAGVGALALLLIISRIIWSLLSKQPPHVTTGSPLMNKLGAAAPKVLNLLSLIVVVSGVTMGVGSGLIELIVTGVGQLPEDFKGSPIRIVHGLGSKLLIAGVLLHIVAALVHQLVIKDGILSRISPFARGDK